MEIEGKQNVFSDASLENGLVITIKGIYNQVVKEINGSYGKCEA